MPAPIPETLGRRSHLSRPQAGVGNGTVTGSALGESLRLCTSAWKEESALGAQ